jgi:hypothetical protein
MLFQYDTKESKDHRKTTSLSARGEMAIKTTYHAIEIDFARGNVND